MGMLILFVTRGGGVFDADSDDDPTIFPSATLLRFLLFPSLVASNADG